MFNLKPGYNLQQQQDPLSYQSIKNTLYEWRRSGGKSSQFNEFDQPGHLFFKVMFHFWNGDAYNVSESWANHNGLLTPAWLGQEGSSNGEYERKSSQDITNKVASMLKNQDTNRGSYNPYDYLPQHLIQNCAYNFLLRNDELERAEKLKQFITLLSNISTYSPWYFYEISGLDGALERPFTEENYKLKPPAKINIKCLPDSEDNRIATLLDLYRDVSYSHTWAREILPANLRKFDMSIFIFSSPVKNLHSSKNGYGATMNVNEVVNVLSNDGDPRKNRSQSKNQWYPAFKCIELHDCEIDYNSSKTGYGSLTNEAGFQQVFNITLNVGNAYEYRYNPYIDRMIGDVVAMDLAQYTYSDGIGANNIYQDTPQVDNEDNLNNLQKRLYANDGGNFNPLKLIDDLTGNVASEVVKSQILGNIYKVSISDIMRGAGRLAQSAQAGNVGGVIQAVNELSEVKNGWYVKDLGSINDRVTIYNRNKRK
jgi:hypothetical protein